jgi:hypothetical protein
MNIECAAQRIEAFAHADQAQPLAGDRLGIEPNAPVDHRERDSVAVAAQVHEHLRSPAVLERVLQRLLCDAEQTQRQLGRQRGWDMVVPERDRQLQFREFPLQRLQRWHQSDQLQRSWMHTVRQGVEAACDRVGALEHRVQHRVIGPARASQQFELDGEQRDLLADVVVEFARNARTF